MNVDSGIFEKIERLRKKMILMGMSAGFTSKEVINLSEKLDNLLNQLRGNTSPEVNSNEKTKK